MGANPSKTTKERRQSAHSIKSGHSDRSKSKVSEKDVIRTRPPTRKSTSSIFSKSRLPNGSAKAVGRVTSSSNLQPAKTKTTHEIERLGSLCEARTKELTQTKIQLKASNQAFDAMSVLLNYSCTHLNAFECPQIAANLATVQRELADCLAQIAELSKQKEELTSNLDHVTKEKEDASQKAEQAVTTAESEREEHSRLTKELDNTHNAALTAQRDELTTKHEQEVKKYKTHHEQQMQQLKQCHERALLDMNNENKIEMNRMQLTHLEDIQKLRNKHDSQMEELHKQHRNKLEEITHRFETIKLTLSEKVESLKGECEDHLRRARRSEEALQKDADVKVQMALAPYLALPKEIESLKTVVEMRNGEIQKLRNRNTEIESQLEEIPIARDKIISLQQKVENLEAIISIKTDHEKQLHERCQVLMRKYDRESKANKRISMDYEQVVWRMSQSEYGSTESLTKRQLSRSPPRSETPSPDVRRRIPVSSPNSEVQLRVKTRSDGDRERNLRSRSATFVIDRNVEDADSFGSSPPSSHNSSNNNSKNSPLRLKKKSSDKDSSQSDINRRMCQSAGAEIISADLNRSSNGDSDLEKSLDNNVFEIHNEDNFDTNGLLDSSYDMMMSGSNYARSISGVSDSGMCDGPHSGNFDSMTGSEMLNSSVFSDSEWATMSANASLTFDSTHTRNETFQSEQSSYGEICNSDTVVDISSLQTTANQSVDNNSATVSSSESSSHYSSSMSGDDTIMEKTMLTIGGNGESSFSKEGESFQTLPEAEEEVSGIDINSSTC